VPKLENRHQGKRKHNQQTKPKCQGETTNDGIGRVQRLHDRSLPKIKKCNCVKPWSWNCKIQPTTKGIKCALKYIVLALNFKLFRTEG